MTIQPMRPEHVADAKRVVAAVAQELWGVPGTLDEMLEEFTRRGWRLADLEDLHGHYFGNGGTFLVLLDGERVVGTGGVRRIDEETAELKRMWFLSEARGRGFGRKMLEQLIGWAREASYQRLRLDVFDPPRQEAAVALYRKVGFVEVPKYHPDSACQLWMEFRLQPESLRLPPL